MRQDTLLSLPPQGYAGHFACKQWIRTQVLLFARQVSFLLNHAPQPLYPAASIVLLYMEMEK